MQKLSRIFDYPKWLALIIGALSATGFAPLGLWPVTLICFALLIHLTAIAPNKKAAFSRGWLFGVGHFVVGLNWIATAFTFQAAMPAWLGYLAVVLLSLYLAIYPAFTTLGAWWIAKIVRKSRPGENGAGWVLILAFAGTWIITEWMRSWVFTGFIWNPLSAVMSGGGLFLTRPFATVGTYGMSAVIVIFAGSLLGITLAIIGKKGKIAIAALAAPIATYASLIIIHIVYVAVAPSQYDNGLVAEMAEVPITVVQPNIGQDDKWEEENVAVNFGKLAALTRSDSNEPRLIFWPEAAIPDFIEKGYPRDYYSPSQPEETRSRLRATMNAGDIMMLGALKLDIDDSGRVYGARNSVMAMDSEKMLVGSYDKSHLVPYGEYLPMRDFLSLFGLSRLAPGDLDFTPGPGPRNIELGGFGTAGIQVCYEIIFSGQVVDPNNRPDFIFNPSNDAWFGSWGPPQHLAQARLRAIEEGLPIIRSTPTGISAVIDANGQVLKSIPMHEAGRVDMMLPAANAPTLFSRYGNILPIGFAILLLLSAVAIGLRRR